MRLVATALILVGLTLAVSAGPGEAAKRPSPTPAAAPDGLRGPLGAARPKPLQSSIPTLAAAYPASAAHVVVADSCRRSCARDYYFCLAGETPEQCPQQWISCRLTCLPPAGSAARP